MAPIDPSKSILFRINTAPQADDASFTQSRCFPGGASGFFAISQRALALTFRRISPKYRCYMDAALGGNREGCVLSSAKVNILFRIGVVFSKKMFRFSRSSVHTARTCGLFFETSPFSCILPLFFGERGVFLPPLRPALSFPAHRHALSRTCACASRTQRVLNICLHPSPSPLTRCILVVYG